MAQTIMQVSTDFKEQHALPGISRKSIVLETPDWVVVKIGLAEKVRKGFQGSRSACVEIQNSKRHRILANSETVSG